MSTAPLSESQKSIVDGICQLESGKFIIKACPGSGKTFTVANLFWTELSKWKDQGTGIATISFTNVAHREISQKLNEISDLPLVVKSPHFVGTIDSFLNQNILFPFGSSAIGCIGRPSLQGEPYGTWWPITEPNTLFTKKVDGGEYSYPYKKQVAETFTHLIRELNGGLKISENLGLFEVTHPIRKFNSSPPVKNAITNYKNKINSLGYVTQDDANYFCLKTLENNPYIAKFLAKRYPYIIIDEAQDSSEIQSAIFDILLANGLKKIVLVGDPDQAIYEWNNAKPKLFDDKFTSNDWSRFELKESYRNSLNICNFASRFRGVDGSVSSAIDCESHNFQLMPLLVGYSDIEKLENFNDIKSKFIQICTENEIEINSNKVAVLCKASGDLVITDQTSNGSRQTTPTFFDWKECKLNHTRNILKCKYLFDNGLFDKSVDELINAKIKIKYQTQYPILDQMKEYIYENGGEKEIFVKNIIEIKGWQPIKNNLVGWVSGQPILSGENYALFGSLASIDKLFYKEKENTFPDSKPVCSTIHGVKGRTFDAVLLFLKSKSTGGKFVNELKKRQLLIEEKGEDLRVLYVAVTRPRCILMIAVPNNELTGWETIFSGLTNTLAIDFNHDSTPATLPVSSLVP